MLILTRRVGETLIIEIPGQGLVEVTVLNVKGTQTRIGINAPKSIKVHREEIYERIKREGEVPFGSYDDRRPEGIVEIKENKKLSSPGRRVVDVRFK